MRLFIVESPAKCKKITEYLGPGWKVLATMGHIRGLEETLDSVGIERDWEPRFRILDGKTKAFKDIKTAAKDAEEVWLGTDDDREGEAISWHICQLLKLPVTTTPRAIFHEVTETAIQASVKGTTRLDMNKVNAQIARSMLDLLVGFSISPVLWKNIGYGLSAGRCQTPALHLVYDKEKEIQGFQSAQSWTYEAIWSVADVSLECVATWVPTSLEEVRTYIEGVPAAGKLVDMTEKSQTLQSPQPLITSSLQQEVSSSYHINPKMTMSIAQKLYEQGHITYMRTDNPVISEEAKVEIVDYITENWSAEYVLTGAKKKAKKTTANTKEVVQGAHEAIRPTHIDVSSLPTEETWSDQERKVYAFIWRRTLQSMMSACVQKSRTLTFQMDTDPADHQWRGSISHLAFRGWKILQPDVTDDERWSKTDGLEKMKEKTKAKWSDLVGRQVATQPPSRFSEAQLIKQLEERGIGRPSTFATLISTILDRKYVEKKTSKGVPVDLWRLERSGPKGAVKQSATKKDVGGDKDKIHLTSLGLSVIEFVDTTFADIFAYDFTASMEDDLDLVARDEKAWKTILGDLWSSLKERVATASSNGNGNDGYNKKVLKQLGDISIANTKKGILLIKTVAGAEKPIFAAMPTDMSADTITQEEAEALFTKKAGDVIGELDGVSIFLKSGQYGAYMDWNGVKAKYKEGMTDEEMETALKAKANVGEKQETDTTADSFCRVVGDYTIKKGPYGLYFFKTAVQGTGRKNLKFPADLNATTIGVTECDAAFKTAAKKKTEGGSFRGRGRGRGH
jgi:DNA topoisomerase-1